MTTPSMAQEPAAEAKSGVAIRIAGVTKIFGADGDKPFEALRAIDMDIRPGEFISVVGPSGCGKSTLMLMVAGLLSRSGGDMTNLAPSKSGCSAWVLSSTR